MKLVDELTPPLRIKISVGDVFAYSIRGTFRYFRVIQDIYQAGSGTAVLYFYEATSSVMEQVPALEKEHLLLPPVRCWREVLRDGFSARVLKGEEYGPIDRFPIHCFDAKGTSFAPYCDEFGKRLAERIEPCGDWGMPMSFGSLEIKISKQLGMFESSKHHEELPELPRPLLRKAWAGKLPSRFAQVVVPGASFESFSHLVNIERTESQDGFGAWERAIAMALQKVIYSIPGFSSVAEQSWPPALNYEPPSLFMTVKKRQHAKFFEMIAEAMQRLGVGMYYIQDSVLHDWLAGTHKPANHRPL